MRVRHYAIAAKFFQNALRFDQQLAANLRQSTLQTMSSASSCEIMYNLGIAMLHLRRPKEAFQCFLVPIKQYHNNPRLWHRMAEACIMEQETVSAMLQQLLQRFLITSFNRNQNVFLTVVSCTRRRPSHMRK